MCDDEESMDQELKQYLDALKIELKSDIENVKQTLLSESSKRASPADLRAQTRRTVLRVMDLEMELAALGVGNRDGKRQN